MDFDLVVVGGGINGVGVARDAAGRGLRVLLVERDDLAAHTSSASSKLIHGGLRYLERFEFRLVAESLAERRILLAAAPHLVHPLEFVIPYTQDLRPAWMIRLGLAFYDWFGRGASIAASRTLDLRRDPHGAALKPEFARGFVYTDAAADDARLVIATALDAAWRGARIRTRTRCVSAHRDGDQWLVELAGASGAEQIRARAIVNATGAWAERFAAESLGCRHPGALRLVKGSHIAVPRLYDGDHAYLLQNSDGRVVFLFPYGADLTAIGTTDVAHTSADDKPLVSDEEIAYLCASANRYCPSTCATPGAESAHFTTTAAPTPRR
jgi:glycerol-3-phosphate dehydrogenase